MSTDAGDIRLRSLQSWTRVAFLAATAVLALGLRAIDPTTLSWLPIRTSCGALTGLPCIFCGTTRALHHVLNGHFALAFYFNWIAFPVAAFAVTIFSKTTIELILKRHFEWKLPSFRVTPHSALITATCLTALWIFQVALALIFQKHELLNPDGLLYALLVR